jgi:membrane protein YdbS with pleckstrin-like domain
MHYKTATTAALALFCALAFPAYALAAQRDVQFISFGALFVFACVVVAGALIWHGKRRRRGTGWH